LGRTSYAGHDTGREKRTVQRHYRGKTARPSDFGFGQSRAVLSKRTLVGIMTVASFDCIGPSLWGAHEHSGRPMPLLTARSDERGMLPLLSARSPSREPVLCASRLIRRGTGESAGRNLLSVPSRQLIVSGATRSATHDKSTFYYRSRARLQRAAPA
jgi:hypothetical protein